MLTLKIWNIEFRECGVWTELDYAESFEDALTIASSYVNGKTSDGQNVREEWLRIVTPEGQIL